MPLPSWRPPRSARAVAGDAGPVAAPGAGRGRRMLPWELARNVLTQPAIVAGSGGGVILLVAIEVFAAGPAVKAALSAASSLGLLVAPLVVTAVARTGVTANRALALLTAAAGAALAIAGVGGGLWPFAFGALFGVPLLYASLPLVTAIWQEGVPHDDRGRWFGIVSSAAAAGGIAAGAAMAAALGDDASGYRPVVLAIAALLGAAAAVALRLPEQRLARGARNPLHRLGLLIENRPFGYLSASWMLLGLGNLATIPLRTEWVTGGSGGVDHPAGTIVVLTVVLPQATSLLVSPAWGRVFDRFDFLKVRIGLNALFAASIALFFTPWLAAQAAGSLLFGAAQGGGHIVWSLWVTKYAPPDQTADHMAVHTFLTGTRGAAAPFLAYALLRGMEIQTVALLGIALIAVASAMLAPLFRGAPGARA